MNKKMSLVLFAVFNIIAMFILIVPPVHAYQYYHGYTQRWDRGGRYFMGWAWASYDTSIGYIGAGATADGGDDYAWAYMNSANVDAVADVDSIRVYVCWDGSTKITFPWSYGTWECRLYVNGYFKGIQYSDSIQGGSEEEWGYVYFDFSAPNTKEGDELDIDLKAYVSASTGYAVRGAFFTCVLFTTE